MHSSDGIAGSIIGEGVAPSTGAGVESGMVDMGAGVASGAVGMDGVGASGVPPAIRQRVSARLDRR